MIDRFTRRPALLAAILGCAAIVMTAAYFRVREESIANMGRPVRYLAAAHDLPTQTQLASAMLTWREVPRQFLHPDAILDLAEADGLITQAPLVAGEPVTRARLKPPGDGTGFAATIPTGLRAISVPVDAVSGVAGLIEPGNFVDLVATFDFGESANAQSFTMTLFNRVPVVAVDQRVALFQLDRRTSRDPLHARPDAGPRVQEQTVTLALPPDRVQRVIFAQETGRLRLALRPQSESPDAGVLAPHEPATAASVTGMNNLVKRKEYRGK